MSVDEKLKELKDSGKISQEEFDKYKDLFIEFYQTGFTMGMNCAQPYSEYNAKYVEVSEKLRSLSNRILTAPNCIGVSISSVVDDLVKHSSEIDKLLNGGF